MSGPKDPKVEPEFKSVASQPNQVEAETSKKETVICQENSPPVVTESVETQKLVEPNDVVENVGYKSEIQKEEDIKAENSITIYNPPEQTEENSKAFMESIGSWINDFFNASNKIPDPDLKPEKVDTQKEMTLEHAEYLKLLNAIKKQWEKKMKNETSVRVSTPDKPFEYNFESDLKLHKRKTKSQPSLGSTQYLEEIINPQDDFSETLEYLEKQNDSNHASILSAREEDIFEDFFYTKSVKNLNTFLVKEKKKSKNRNRSERKELKEYVLPTSNDLSKRILLNINEQEKNLYLLKNSHLGVQESQHYGKGKKRAHQVNARCYTTKANTKENLENSSLKNANRCSQYCTSQAAKMKGADEILSRNSMDIKKYISHRAMKQDNEKDSVALTKTKNQKSLANSETETAKGDTKTSSDELVKYLMKKIKTSPRPNQLKKKNLSIFDVGGSEAHKNRFKRSATNNLVMRIAAKNDVQMSLRSDSRAVPENKLLGSKEVHVKYPENLRFDVSRAVNPSKFNKCSYLPERDRVEDDGYFLEKKSYKNFRRFNEDYSRPSEKKTTEKFKTFNNIPKMEVNYIAAQKPKPKEIRKEIESSDGIDMTETQIARFKKQHELFKTTFKTAEATPTLEVEATENKTEKQVETSSGNLLPVEFADPRTTLQLAPEEKDKIMKTTTLITPPPPKEPECKVVDCLSSDKKTLNLKVEKKVPERLYFGKNKGQKTKPSLLLKDTDSKALLSNPLVDLCNAENKIQKDTPRNFEPSLCSAELRAAKSTETVVFNRRYSTNSLTETSQQNQPNDTSSYFLELGENSSSKEVKEKKKEKNPKSEGQEVVPDESCGFQSVKKKPGPTCGQEE